MDREASVPCSCQTFSCDKTKRIESATVVGNGAAARAKLIRPPTVYTMYVSTYLDIDHLPSVKGSASHYQLKDLWTLAWTLKPCSRER